MTTPSKDPTYPSRFVAKLEVTIAEYITEILIQNYLVWQKKPMPRNAFWRKGITENSKEFKTLKNKFVAELTMVKDLIKVFSPSVVAKYFLEHKCVGYRTVKSETRLKILDGIYREQLIYNKSMFNGTAKQLEQMADKRQFTGVRSSFTSKNKMSQL